MMNDEFLHFVIKHIYCSSRRAPRSSLEGRFLLHRCQASSHLHSFKSILALIMIKRVVDRRYKCEDIGISIVNYSLIMNCREMMLGNR